MVILGKIPKVIKIGKFPIDNSYVSAKIFTLFIY